MVLRRSVAVPCEVIHDGSDFVSMAVSPSSSHVGNWWIDPLSIIWTVYRSVSRIGIDTMVACLSGVVEVTFTRVLTSNPGGLSLFDSLFRTLKRRSHHR